MDDFDTLPKMAGWHESKLLVPTSKLAVSSITPNHMFHFHNGENTVGTLNFNGAELVFNGNADESAKVFFDFVAKYFDQRLKDEYTKGYNDAKKENT